MKTLYVAGPLNSDACGYLKNVHSMLKHADAIRRKGWSVFIPALDLLCGIYAGDLDYPDYFENNAEWLRRSDAVFVCPGWEASKGTAREMAIASEMGKPIYFNLEGVPNA
jgi:hypothetical protein